MAIRPWTLEIFTTWPLLAFKVGRQAVERITELHKMNKVVSRNISSSPTSRQLDGAKVVDVHDLLVCLDRRVRHLPPARHPAVVDQDVDPPEDIDRLSRLRGQRAVLSEVKRKHNGYGD